MKRINSLCALLLTVMLIPNHAEALEELVCNGAAIDFESGIPASFSAFAFGNVYWTTTADSTGCGQPNQTPGADGEAACADSNETNEFGGKFDTEMRTNSFDLSDYFEATLNFDAAYVDDVSVESVDRFDVDVSTNSGSTWSNHLSWDEPHNPGQNIAINLTPYVGEADVRVRFRYFGEGWRFWAQVDDIELECKSRSTAISVEGGYIKLDATNGNAPSNSDCTETAHYGRMIVDDASNKLYICTDSGWKTTDLKTPVD